MFVLPDVTLFQLVTVSFKLLPKRKIELMTYIWLILIYSSKGALSFVFHEFVLIVFF